MQDTISWTSGHHQPITPSRESCQALQRYRILMIKLIAPVVAPGKKKWEEKTKRGGYFTTQSGWWRDDNVLSLKGLFHSPPIPLCSHCCFSDSPRNWFQIWKTLSFQRNGLMQVIRLGANFFQRQLACLFKPLFQLTCTAKPYPERVWQHCPSTHRSYPTKALSWVAIPSPLLKWHKSSHIHPEHQI